MPKEKQNEDGKSGRSRQIPAVEVDAIIESFAEDIFANGKVVSKKNKVWKFMSEETKGVKSAGGFYSYFMDNRNNIRTRLQEASGDFTPALENTSTNLSNELNDEAVTTIGNETEASILKGTKVIQINFTQREFIDLLQQKQYNRNEENRPKLSYRQYTTFLPGAWQHVITEKLWAKKEKHGFHFKTHKFSWYLNTAYFEGSCKCGSEIRGDFEDITCDNIVVRCTITPGDGSKCGKRYCRGSEREAIGKMLVEGNKGVYAYRNERADELMSAGDPEPGHFYSADVYRMIKSQEKKHGRKHTSVLTSLEILQLTELKGVIHLLSVNPFNVHYWSHHQLDVYRNYCKTENSRIAIDSTGGIVRKIHRLDKTKSGVIFLYQCVVNDGQAQYSVSQMLTDAHHTNSITFWLTEWLKSGAPYPKEVVSDSSLALIAASVRAFTGYLTINDYLEACTETRVPTCYIRLDVAHIMKGYADFLSDTRIRIKRFYLGCIGQLILATDKPEAEERLTWLLTVCRSETEGRTENGPTLCDIRKRKLHDLLIQSPNSIIDETITSVLEDDAEGENGNVDDQQKEETEKAENYKRNSWHAWGLHIDDSVKEAIENEIGDGDNAHFHPRLADRLVRDMNLFPMWSCVCRNTFGYGRQPASSAPVESDFKNLKRNILQNEALPMRADDFIKKHIKHISGKTKIIDAIVADAESETDEETSKFGDSESENANNVGNAADDHLQFEKDVPIANSTYDGETESQGRFECEKQAFPVKSIPELTVGSVSVEEQGRFDVEKTTSTLDNICLPTDTLASGTIPADRKIPEAELGTRNLPKIIENMKYGEGCVACLRQDVPSGAHKCVFCKKPVHALPNCSEPAEGEEEGYGQKRVCVACLKHFPDSVSRNLVSSAKENWRNLAASPLKWSARNAKAQKRTASNGSDHGALKVQKLDSVAAESKKQSRYLQPNFLDHELVLHEKLSKVPILRNGNQMGLKPISLKNRKITLSNTCAFDSVFQIFLTSALDSAEFCATCRTTPNEFLGLVQKVARDGVRADSYRIRAKILSEIGTITQSHCGVDLIDCQLTVGGLCQELFKDVPSLTEIVRCSGGCPERRIALPRIQINRSEADTTIRFTKAIEDCMALDNRRCPNHACPSTVPLSVLVEPE